MRSVPRSKYGGSSRENEDAGNMDGGDTAGAQSQEVKEGQKGKIC